MKNFYSSVLLVLLLSATPLLAQDCTNTPNTGAPLSLALPVAHCQQWNTQLNNNFSAINTFAGGVVLLTPTTSQTIQQPSATSLNVNALQVYGVTSNLAFGTLAGTPTGYLSEPSAASFSLDANTPGDAGGSLSLTKVNASAGFVYNNGSGVSTGNCLVAGSDSVHTFAPQTCVLPSTVKYQTVVSGTSAQTQRSKLQFGTEFAVADNSGSDQTQVDLANTGATAGTYTDPTLVIDAMGRILSAANGGGSGSLTSNGYWTFPGGLILQWKTSATDFPANGRLETTETWPIPFPNGCLAVVTTAKPDTAITANYQGYGIFVNPGDCKTSVSIYGEVGSDTTADSTYRAFLVAIGY